MRKSHIWFCLAVLGAACIGLILFSGKSPGERSTLWGDEDTPTQMQGSAARSRVDGADIRALKTKLAQNETALAALLAQNARNARDDEHSDSVSSEEDRVRAVQKTLDERLTQHVSSSSKATQFRTEIKDVIDQGALGSSEVTALACAETLCKLSVENNSKNELESSVISLSRSLGKTSGALMVFDGDPGEKQVYIGKSGDDLAVSLPGAPEEAEPVIIREEERNL